MSKRAEQLDTFMSRVYSAFLGALLIGALVLLLAGCSTLFPNLTVAIEPQGASVEEAGMALLADFQMWITSLGGLIASIFGG